MKILSSKQKHDILNSLNKIKEEIEKLQSTTMLTDGELMFFYEELKSKADFGYNFIKCADMCERMQSGENIEIK